MTRRKPAQTIEAEGKTFRRIFVGVGQSVEQEGGGTASYKGGEFYHVPDSLAAEWIEKDVAYDPEDPPACPVCGEGTTQFVVEGDKVLGPRALIERHLIGNHPEAVPDAAKPEDAKPAPGGEG